MPVPLIVIGIIALIIAGIMAIRATVYIDYRDEVRLTVSVAGLKIKILPKKEPAPVNIDDYSPKKFKKMLAKKKKKEEKLALKKKKKDEKKQAKKLAKKEAKKKAKEQEKLDRKAGKPKKEKRSLVENISLVTHIVGIFFRRFAKHFRIKVARLNIIIATGDAATTAITYGVAVQGVEYILALLDKVTNVKYKKDAEVYVGVDYLTDKTQVDVSLAFSLRVWHLFDILFRVAFGAVAKLVKQKNNK